MQEQFDFIHLSSKQNINCNLKSNPKQAHKNQLLTRLENS